MHKKYIIICFLFVLQLIVKGQDASINSKQIEDLKNSLLTAKEDSTRIFILGRLGFTYQGLNIDSALKYTYAGINLAKEKGNSRMEANILATLSGIMSQQGKFAEALDMLFKSLKIAEDNNLTYEIARANRRLGGVYFDLENYRKAISYDLIALKLDKENGFESATIDHIFLANAYDKLNILDTALFHTDKAIERTEQMKDVIQTAYRIAGDINVKKGNYQQADSFFREGLDLSINNSDFLTMSEIYSSLATMYIKLNKKDSALFYALKGFEYGDKVSYKKAVIVSAGQLADLYDSTQPAVALKYFKIVAAEKDSLFGVANVQTIQNLISHEEEKQKEFEKARASYQNSLKFYGLLTGIVTLLIIAFILSRNIKHKQKANRLLASQKNEIERTLEELKATQKQLIQSEKMASLGELTAGIAHEIQNPLNFVNNFSEVSVELIEELKSEKAKPKSERDDLLEEDMLNDIARNLEKINLHGKRADGIVKGMLQHSRSSRGQKELTDINVLADEYLRLSYHGLRAKDKSFNVTLKTDFDKSIGNINIIPQDIGRVILNLITNAFYVVDEKKKQGTPGYEPTVSISTKKTGNKVEINVLDNGNGISKEILDKIFQPFFTTKPTGQGTGLGLSLSYDIVKAHGGELKVETKEGEGTTFIIQLPII